MQINLCLNKLHLYTWVLSTPSYSMSKIENRILALWREKIPDLEFWPPGFCYPLAPGYFEKLWPIIGLS